MLETRACTNTRYMVQREPRFEHDSNVSVLSSDDESTPSETTLDEICESLQGPGQDILGADFSSQTEGGHLPIWFNRVGGFQHNSSSIGFCHTLGEFPGVISSIVSRNTVPFRVKMFAEGFHTMPLRRDRFHIGTLHCAEAR